MLAATDESGEVQRSAPPSPPVPPLLLPLPLLESTSPPLELLLLPVVPLPPLLQPESSDDPAATVRRAVEVARMRRSIMSDPI